MRRKTSMCICILSLAASTVFAAQTGKTTQSDKELNELQKQATRLDSEARQTQKSDTVFESLSKQLNVPVATLQTQQQTTGFGFGQLFIANSLAATTGKSFDTMVQDFNSGKGWGVVAKENNVKLGRVVSDMKRANNSIRDQRVAREHGVKAQRGARTNTAGPKGPRGRGRPRI